ncbi:unnamed protein product [Choristocarpus tenellus]
MDCRLIHTYPLMRFSFFKGLGVVPKVSMLYRCSRTRNTSSDKK